MNSASLTKELSMLIGRQKEIEQIVLAVQGTGSPILFLEGVAGIGKTLLLEKTERVAQEMGVLCPPVIDFYDIAMHSHQGLEAAIAQYLDPSREAFKKYWMQREKDPQAELWELFRAGYQAALGDRCAVLRFDTAEHLEYERDSQAVRDDCEVGEQDAPSWEWLLERINDLPQTAILIAARPTELLKQRLLGAHGDRVRVLPVMAFTPEETIAYLREAEFGAELVEDSSEVAERIHQLSGGRPILIALTLDWLKRGEWDRQKLFTIQPGNFEMALVSAIRGLKSPLDRAVKYAALARKGYNADLLSCVMEVSVEEASDLVRQLQALSFVKLPRGERGLYFLHDEMYDLVEKYVWLLEWPDYREQVRLDRVIIDWYSKQIEALRRRIREARGRQERARLRREQQLLTAERLYYQFDEDPRLGYREYSHLEEEAIAQRELEWDTWLHNEALWFTTHRAWRRGYPDNQASDYPKRDPAWVQNGKPVRNPTVDCDSRRRWISRYIARNQMSQAVRIAEKLLGQPCLLDEPELYRPGLKVAMATAQAFLGGKYIKTAIENFSTGFDMLQDVPAEHRGTWLHPYLLGTAYLYGGLALRGKLSLDQAGEAYSQAIRYFRQISYRPGLAEAINNLAYVLVRQGRLDPALTACSEALRIRQELGNEYGIGLSLNTKGIIHERMGRPITAIANSEQALAIFREIANTRGLMMTRINLGRSYRRKARSPEWGRRDSDFRKGESYLKKAIKSSDPDTDRFYQVEAFNELGCLYRDWVATLHEKGERNGRIWRFLELAEENLKRAVELTAEQGPEGMPHVMQHVDAWEDLARVHYWRARLEQPCHEGNPLDVMNDQLKRAEDLAQQYVKGHRELNLILGKVFFQRARVARLESQPVVEVVGGHYGLAAGFAESYSLDAPEAHKFADDACDWLGKLDAEKAAKAVEAMHGALQREGLESKRLSNDVENVIRPLLGVGWPTEQ